MSEENVLIKCDELVKIYKADDVEVFALQGLDLEIRRGEIIAVVGKSGSGKSTLMSLIGGLDTPSAGSLSVNGENIFATKKKELEKFRRNNIGFVWQMCSKNLIPYLSAAENIQVMMNNVRGHRNKKRKAYELLELVGLKGKERVLPSQMSGGEQQRVAIAVAICNSPKILLADEPTGAVDSKTSDKIQELFRKLNKELGITIIIVTHDMKLADRVDRTVYIADGKISTEKVNESEVTDEYSVLDKAGRIKLDDDILEAAGISGKRVKLDVEDGKIIITA